MRGAQREPSHGRKTGLKYGSIAWRSFAFYLKSNCCRSWKSTTQLVKSPDIVSSCLSSSTSARLWANNLASLFPNSSQSDPRMFIPMLLPCDLVPGGPIWRFKRKHWEGQDERKERMAILGKDPVLTKAI